MRYVSAAVSIACMFAMPACAAGLVADGGIVNGGFELPKVAAGSIFPIETGGHFSAWTVTGAAGSVDLVGPGFTEGGFTFQAMFGKQFVNLAGGSQTATGISQSFASVRGVEYTLTFWVSSVYDPGGIYGTSSTVHVMQNDRLVFTATVHGIPERTDQYWKAFRTTINARGTKTKLTFLNGDRPGDADCGLDRVYVTDGRNEAMLAGLRQR